MLKYWRIYAHFSGESGKTEERTNKPGAYHEELKLPPIFLQKNRFLFVRILKPLQPGVQE